MTAPHRRLPVFAAAAVLFDLDGVLTDTASVHRRAWADLFTAYLGTTAPDKPPYTDNDYFTLLDGKSRIAGVRAVLESRGIDLDDGTPDDPPGTPTVNGLANEKNATYGEILRNEGVKPFADSLRLVDALAEAHIPLAVVSSSRNARAVLATAALQDRFAVVIDGVDAARCGLRSKPAPDTFLAAAKLLHVSPEHSVVIEDAVSGVEAARAGGFHVVAVDRGSSRQSLAEAGAHEVVADPAELLQRATP